jgi:aspartate/methionine/tyrosine aminotransferase
MTMLRFHAPYLEWAKSRPSARFDLAGSNVLACSIDELPGAREAIAFDGRNDAGYLPLIDSIATRYGVAREQVTTAQGASGANFLACAALLEPGDEVLVETPGYDPLLGAPRLLGAQVNRFDRDFADGFAVDPDRVRRSMTPRTRLIIITTPHNPSGVLADSAALDEIGSIAEANGAHVLLDEVYLDLAAASPHHPVKPERTFATRGNAFVCTNSLTKSYGLSGLRCGWILSSADVAERIRRARDVVDGTGSIVAERLAALAFTHLDRLLARATGLVDRNGALVRDFLRSRTDLTWVEPAGTVVFPLLRGLGDTTTFTGRLLKERETAIVPGHFFQAPRHVRIGFGGLTDALREGLQAIRAALDESITDR